MNKTNTRTHSCVDEIRVKGGSTAISVKSARKEEQQAQLVERESPDRTTSYRFGWTKKNTKKRDLFSTSVVGIVYLSVIPLCLSISSYPHAHKQTNSSVVVSRMAFHQYYYPLLSVESALDLPKSTT